MLVSADARPTLVWYDDGESDGNPTGGRQHNMGVERSGVSVLIAARPGPLRIGLQALLTMMPQIGTIEGADSPLATLEAIKAHHPDLVLLDANLSNNGVSSVLRMVKSASTQSRHLVLANDAEQRRVAEAAGADVALVKGFPAARLFETIDALLPK
jgi:DNA-binding NarL/FixJ family response regulator